MRISDWSSDVCSSDLEYGGAGLPLSAAAAILEEIQRQGCNGGAVHAPMYVMGTLLRHGSEEQKARYLPRVATGDLRLQAFGVPEPASGTDARRLNTTAQQGGDNYVENAQNACKRTAATPT